MRRGILAIEAGYETVGDVLSRRSRGGQLLVATHDHNETGIYPTFEKVFWSVVIMNARLQWAWIVNELARVLTPR